MALIPFEQELQLLVTFALTALLDQLQLSKYFFSDLTISHPSMVNPIQNQDLLQYWDLDLKAHHIFENRGISSLENFLSELKVIVLLHLIFF
jgi:hypothetical protein